MPTLLDPKLEEAGINLELWVIRSVFIVGSNLCQLLLLLKS